MALIDVAHVLAEHRSGGAVTENTPRSGESSMLRLARTTAPARFAIILIACLFLAFAQPAAAQGGKYKEAPALAELVKAGKLPPVEQRLP